MLSVLEIPVSSAVSRSGAEVAVLLVRSMVTTSADEFGLVALLEGRNATAVILRGPALREMFGKVNELGIDAPKITVSTTVPSTSRRT